MEKMRNWLPSLALLVMSSSGLFAWQPGALPLEGSFRFTPSASEDRVPAAYRMEPADFAFKTKRLHAVEGAYTVYSLQFPSPVKSPFPENNTVHARY